MVSTAGYYPPDASSILAPAMRQPLKAAVVPGREDESRKHRIKAAFVRPLFVSHFLKRCPCLGFPVIEACDHGEE